MRIHQRENNSESQAHLDKNKAHFSKQCLLVLELLRQGKRLTTINAPSYGILSLPRRLKDLRENGIFVDERWVKLGDREIKEWFIQERTDSEKKELQKFLDEWQNEQFTEPKQPLKQIDLFND